MSTGKKADYYGTLEIERHADHSQIKQAYRRMAFKHHRAFRLLLYSDYFWLRIISICRAYFFIQVRLSWILCRMRILHARF